MHCLVQIPVAPGSRDEYPVEASSVFDAIRKALEVHEQRHGHAADDTVVLVIKEGKTAELWDCHDFNAHQPQWRVRVGRVR